RSIRATTCHHRRPGLLHRVPGGRQCGAVRDLHRCPFGHDVRGNRVGGTSDLPGGATIGAAVALRFTPVSTVDPVGPTDIVVTSTTEGTTCSVTVRVTPEGGTQMPATTC